MPIIIPGANYDFGKAYADVSLRQQALSQQQAADQQRIAMAQQQAALQAQQAQQDYDLRRQQMAQQQAQQQFQNTMAVDELGYKRFTGERGFKTDAERYAQDFGMREKDYELRAKNTDLQGQLRQDQLAETKRRNDMESQKWNEDRRAKEEIAANALELKRRNALTRGIRDQIENLDTAIQSNERAAQFGTIVDPNKHEQLLIARQRLMAKKAYIEETGSMPGEDAPQGGSPYTSLVEAMRTRNEEISRQKQDALDVQRERGAAKERQVFYDDFVSAARNGKTSIEALENLREDAKKKGLSEAQVDAAIQQNPTYSSFVDTMRGVPEDPRQARAYIQNELMSLEQMVPAKDRNGNPVGRPDPITGEYPKRKFSENLQARGVNVEDFRKRLENELGKLPEAERGPRSLQQATEEEAATKAQDKEERNKLASLYELNLKRMGRGTGYDLERRTPEEAASMARALNVDPGEMEDARLAYLAKNKPSLLGEWARSLPRKAAMGAINPLLPAAESFFGTQRVAPGPMPAFGRAAALGNRYGQ